LAPAIWANGKVPAAGMYLDAVASRTIRWAAICRLLVCGLWAVSPTRCARHWARRTGTSAAAPFASHQVI
jgi:hypothetical protein